MNKDYAIYIDDSWSPGDRVFALAGYIAPVALWERDFVPRWANLLASAPAPLSEFHTVDCRHRRGEFSGWSKGQCDAITKDIVTLIADELPHAHFLGFGGAIALGGNPHPDYRRMWQEQAFRLALLWFMANALQVGMRATPPGAKLHIVIDNKPGFYNVLHAAWDEWASIAFGDGIAKLATPQFANSHDELPLQAADLLAYETAHEAKQRISEAPREVSQALRRLCAGKHHQANCIWYEDLQARMEHRRETGVVPEGRTMLFHSDFPWRGSNQWPELPGEPSTSI